MLTRRVNFDIIYAIMTFALDKFLRFLPAASFAMAAEFASGFADSVICGQFIGESGLSAINLMQPVMNLVTFVALLTGTGTSVLYATEMGRSNQKRAREYLTQGLWSALLLGAILTAALGLSRNPACEAFGVSGAVLAGLKEYWLWFLPCAILEPLFVYLSCLCYTDGDGKTCIWAYMAQLAGNSIVSVLLVQWFGFAGCALGTAFGHVGALAILTIHFRKETNTLEYAKYFSLKDTFDICKCSIGDASSRICQGLLMLALNFYVVSMFGEGMLPVLAVAVVVLSVAEMFDGVPRAVQPLASVYIGEKNDRLIGRVMTYAESAATMAGAIFAILFIAFPVLAVKLVGITSPETAHAAKIAVRIVAVGLIGTSLSALFNSYWTYLGKESLALALTVIAMLIAPASLFAIGGCVAGVAGVWTGLALAPYAALAALAAYVTWKRGKKAFPRFLDLEHARHTRIYDLTLEEDSICSVSENIRRFLAMRNGLGEHKASRAALLVEETLMLVKEHNASRRTRAEITIDFSSPNTILVIIRDDGEIFDITDADANISSLRSYLVSNLMTALPARNNIITTGFNRNVYKI